MPKNTCSCANDSNKEYTNEAPTFRTHYLLDNAFIPIFNNPSRTLSDLVQNGAPNSLVDRANCLSCDDSISTQDKLKVRKKDRPTPYRVPYNHFRKVTSCKSDCITNVKINKDLSCNNLDCVPTTYALSRLVDKNGVRNLNNGGNYKNYLQSSGKNYDLNTYGILPECAVSGELHTYKIGSVEGTVLNKNSKTNVSNNCQLGYSYTTSLNDKSFSLIKMNTTTKKYSNPYHNTSGSVSSKAHIHKKKFRNILAGQSIGKKDGYNNCRNGEFCNLYMKPGPNTKLFMGKTSIQRCIPPRIRGIKQTCPYELDLKNPTCESTLYTNPTFQRGDNTTGSNGGTLTITIDHCALLENDEISISFLGYPTSIESIFVPTTSTNAVGAITSSQTTSSGEIITLNITQLTVNTNNITWVMPIDVGRGTTQIVLSNGDAGTFINETNGPPGVIYANVSIPRHITVNSIPAWTIIPVDPCTGRNGSFTNTSITLAGAGATYPPYQPVTPSAGLTHFVVYVTFTLNNDSLINGDILQFLFKTDYGDSTRGFFTGEIDNATWNKNDRPTDQNPDIDRPSIWLEDDNGNLISNAVSTVQITNTSMNTNTNDYRQTLSVTINTSSNISGTVKLGLFDDSRDFLEGHPNSTYDVDYHISANCWTSTGLSNGYSFDPCGGRSGSLTNSSLEATGFGQETPIVEGGDFVRLCSIEFTATNAGLVGGDILILKLITSYTATTNTVDGFFTDNPSTPSFITLNANGYNTNNAYVAMWISQGTTGLTPVSNMISSLSTTFSTTGSGATQKYIQTISITLSGTSTTTYGSAGTTWKINMSGAGSSTTDITQIPITAGTIDYQLDLNCFTGTGEQSGTSWNSAAALTNLSLIPSNSGGYQRTSNGLTNNSNQAVNPVNTIYISISDYNTNEPTRNSVILKFTHNVGLSSGDTIKLTVKKPIPSGTSINSFEHQIFSRAQNDDGSYYLENWYSIPDPFPTSGVGQWRYPRVFVGSNEISIDSEVTAGAYNSTTDSQDVTITLDQSISAGSTVIIKYYDNTDVWRDNTEEGQHVTFDLEVSNHPTSTNNSGWYVQDISGTNLETSVGSHVFKSISSNASQSNVSNIIYRHYSAIPQNSYITIFFQTENTRVEGPPQSGISKPFFDYIGWEDDIVNNAFTTGSGEFGISVYEKDLNNSNTNNDISIDTFKVETMHTDSTYYGRSTQYLRFRINETGGITGGSDKYIQIYINDRGTFQNSGQMMFERGKLIVSIEVRSSTVFNSNTLTENNNNLIASVYGQTMGVSQN